MHKILTPACLAATGLAIALISSSNPAESQASAASMGTYAVTVTNLTRGQIFSPALVATHRGGASVFAPGTPASPELQALAEDGNNALLFAQLATDASVLDVRSGAGMLFPGMSETILIQADASHPLISMAAMLVSTNDAFLGLDRQFLPLRGGEYLVNAYDAGTELNSENCAFIPGPPCGSGGVHDPAAAEGFVYVSNGLHGLGGLAPETYDWRGPVAKVTIVRQ